MTWWGHIVERWCLCQDARLQETKHGCITTQTSLSTYQSKWKEQLEETDMLCVQRSTSSPKERIRQPNTKTCQRALKLFSVYWGKSCEVFCASLLALKTVLNYISECMNGSKRPNFETVCYIVIKIKKIHKHVLKETI